MQMVLVFHYLMLTLMEYLSYFSSFLFLFYFKFLLEMILDFDPILIELYNSSLLLLQWIILIFLFWTKLSFLE